jgi:hypothetical protein
MIPLESQGVIAVSTQQTVLLLGGTGRTGKQVLEQLLSRDIQVRVIVRSAMKLQTCASTNPNLTVVVGNILTLSHEELQRHVSNCDAIISCLGHVISFAGVFGPPYDLVTHATARLCQEVEMLKPVKPVKFILMSSVSVNHPKGLDTHRGMIERAFVGLIRGLIPPARDNQNAANFLCGCVGMTNQFLQWTLVRPDTLLDGDISDYTLHEDFVNSIFSPGSTNMANVAHFMCDLVTNPITWKDWSGKLPVIVNATVA